MDTAAPKQDMPPKGGYAGIQFSRIPLKKPWSGVKVFSAWFGLSLFSYYLYAQNKYMVRRNKRANDDVTVALEPLLIAERDRMYLKQLRKNRDEETELMKNVPGWVVGTYYGEPLYTTIGDKMVEPIMEEYYAHAKNYDTQYAYTYQWWY